jgi:hypothetical protein
MLLPLRKQRRRGATTVETAVVIGIALLFIFGIIEYARFLFFLHRADNAVREAARHAVVHTGDGTTVGALADVPNSQGASANPNYPNGYAAPSTSIRSIVTQHLGGHAEATKWLTGYNVNVYNADPATGQSLGGNWNDSPFGGGMVIELTGTYRFFLPSLLQLSGSAFPISIKAMMTSETN